MNRVTTQEVGRQAAGVADGVVVPFGKDPVRTRIIVVVVGLLLFIVGFVGFFSYQGWLNSRERATVNTLNIVGLLERQFDDSLKKIDVALQTAALVLERERDQQGTSNDTRITEFLVRQQQLLPETLSYRAADVSGVVRYGSGVPADGSASIADREYFQELREHPERRSAMFGPFVSIIEHVWVIGIAHSLHTPDGKFDGVIFATIQAEAFQQKLKQLDLGPAGAVSLRMTDMSLVARVAASNRSAVTDFGSRKVSEELLSAIARNPAAGHYIAVTALDQIERVNAYMLVAGYPMYIIVGMATEDSKAEWLNQSLLIFFLGIVAIGATALGANSIATVRQREFQARLDEVQRSSDKLRAQETLLKLYASVFTHAREGIMITDASGTILEVNDTFSDITGYGRTEVVTRNPKLLSSGRQSPDFYAAMWESLRNNGHWAGELWDRRKDGSIIAVQITISAVRGESGQPQNYVALLSDITSLKNHQQQLEHVAHHDALTGLPNRVLLADRLHQAIIQCQRRSRLIAVAFLDLDGFKKINDLHGHEVGDALLIALAGVMKSALREGDTLARLGGDEFVAVLSDLTQVDDARPVLERLLQAAASQVEVGGLSLRVSASVGVALYPEDGTDSDLLLRAADQAMYKAKQKGRNQFRFFQKDMD